MNHKTIPLLSADFVDADGIRLTSFQLCRHRPNGNGIEAIAIVDFDGDRVSRCMAIHEFEHNKLALVRLAKRYRSRSIPHRFHKTTLPD